MPKELRLFYASLPNVQLYIQLDHFIIVQVTLPALSNQVNSNFMLVLKRLHLNLLNIVALLTFKVVLRRSPYQTQKNLDYLQIEIVKVNPHRDKNIVVPTVCGLSKENISQLIHQLFFSCLCYQIKTNGKKRTLVRYLIRSP